MAPGKKEGGMVDFLPFFIYFARLVEIKDGSNRKNCIFIFLNSFRGVCGKILTLTLEARAKRCMTFADCRLHEAARL